MHCTLIIHLFLIKHKAEDLGRKNNQIWFPISASQLQIQRVSVFPASWHKVGNLCCSSDLSHPLHKLWAHACRRVDSTFLQMCYVNVLTPWHSMSSTYKRCDWLASCVSTEAWGSLHPILLWRQSGVVVPTVASPQEGPWFDPWINKGALLFRVCMVSPWGSSRHFVASLIWSVYLLMQYSCW